MANDVPRDDPWTIGRLLRWTQGFLRDRRSESPRLDAEVMLAHALDYSRVQLYTHIDEEVGSAARKAFRELVRRRAEGEPVAYLVGRKEFYSLPLAVSPAVLIPRPDSEFVVVEWEAALREVEAPFCADIGTGSGNLAIACASRKPEARFLAVDRGAGALDVARGNAERLGMLARIEFVLGDLLGPIADRGPFDAIVSNPPYIPTDAIETLEPGVRDYEPREALDGGPDGLRVVARLVEESVPLLAPGAPLILEIGSDQEGPVRSLIERTGAFDLAPTVRDGAGHPRVLRASRRGGSPEG